MKGGNLIVGGLERITFRFRKLRLYEEENDFIRIYIWIYIGRNVKHV
jgi:hypothetical protein